jgi:hypothetical protein
VPRTFFQLSPDKTALFLFGVFFITVLLIVAIAVPNPTEAQWRVFNVVLGLVAAAIGATLPGVLHLQFTPWLKAGGALAVFALVFLVKPAGLVADDPFEPLPPPPSIDTARPVVDRWLALLDEGKFEDAYRSTYPGFRMRYQEGDFIRLARDVRLPLGRAMERNEVGQNSTDAPIGDRGHYRVYMFLTRFQGASEPIEEYVYLFAKDSASGWLTAGYSFNVQKAASSRIPISAPGGSPQVSSRTNSAQGELSKVSPVPGPMSRIAP